MDKAQIGVYVTLEEPTKGMVGAAKEAGQYHSEGWDQKYPKVQILTIERLFAGDRPKLPPYKKKGGAAAMPLLD